VYNQFCIQSPNQFPIVEMPHYKEIVFSSSLPSIHWKIYGFRNPKSNRFYATSQVHRIWTSFQAMKMKYCIGIILNSFLTFSHIKRYKMSQFQIEAIECNQFCGTSFKLWVWYITKRLFSVHHCSLFIETSTDIAILN
jgi:hypothetical protein